MLSDPSTSGEIIQMPPPLLGLRDGGNAVQAVKHQPRKRIAARGLGERWPGPTRVWL